MRRQGNIALLTVALYGASFLLPLHELFMAEERCVECHESVGPALARDCGSSPCDDPAHHHHGHHRHHDNCPACSQGKVPCTRPEQLFPAPVTDRVAPLISWVALPAARLFASGHSARGPPSTS